jgi:thiol-disulfide isomerase/thioredoxin
MPTGWKRPSGKVMSVVAAGAALVATVIAIDATAGHKSPVVPPPPAPAFSLPSLRDPLQQISLSAYHGHPVIVNFFASWCTPCQHETPLLARFYRATRGVVIIGVDADDKATAARRFLAANGVTYPVGFESTPAVADAYRVSELGIPETFFLDSRHRIVKRVLGDVSARTLAAGVALIDCRPGTLT